MTDHLSTRTIVLGAGPVGLASALLLADLGHRVSVHEAKQDLDLSATNSYPIGVNPRGQEALRRIDPALLQELRDNGEVVEAFHIYNGTRRVARLESGTLVATTRAFLTRILLERVQQHPSIEYLPGHELTGLDLADRTLTFTRPEGMEVVVDASDARVLAADGVWSTARRALAEQVPGFTPKEGTWGVRFRMAYSQPGAGAPGLDPAVHHIFASKGIYTSTLADGVWGVALTAIEGDPNEGLLLSSEASEPNIRALASHVAQHAPLATPLLDHDDYAAYFQRKPFGGAVVVCNQLAFDEWLLLVGDAAHSVLPPTGEGVNSGLEDACLLAEHAATGSASWFADFEAARLPDLDALGEYAWTLKDNIGSNDPARSGANVVLRIVDAIAARLHLPSEQVEARLFGPAADRTPYREAIGPWIHQRRALYPGVRRVVGAVRRVTDSLGRERRDHSCFQQGLTTPNGENMKITIVGGSQGTGRALAEQALTAGHEVTVVTRSGTAPEGAVVVSGDATNPEVARQAVTGADAVVVTVGGSKDSPRARTDVTRSVVTAMQQAGVDRLVVQTSLGAGDSATQLPWLLAKITPVMLKQPLTDHNAQEDVVRGSGLRWTIVRPAGLTNKPATGRWKSLRHDQPGTLGGRIARGDVAACILDALTDESTVGAQLGVSGA
ncbi:MULTISPECIES: NAD(P)H-binding protein [unclassified Luteococcus]|uniref:NAD(P)H-binding protein n=1 Tax=unclassified Luteococcus TaxID=2639923 RepID=UPI00313C3D10